MLRISIHPPVFGIFRATVNEGVFQSYKPSTLNLKTAAGRGVSRQVAGLPPVVPLLHRIGTPGLCDLVEPELGDLGFFGCERGRFVGFLRGRV